MPSRDLPQGWSPYRVRDLVERHFSGPSPTCDERNIQSDKEWGLLKTTAITWRGWDPDAHKVPPFGYWNQPDIEVRRDDVLVTKAGPRHRVGVVVHVRNTRPRLMVSGKMVGLRPDTSKVVPQILAGALGTADPQLWLDHRTTGMAESQVNFASQVLLDTPVVLPPLPEQRRIAEILDTVDELIRKTEQLIAKLKQVKQGLLHDLLTRGIDDNGELRDPDRHPEQFKDSPLGRIPNRWEVEKLGRLTSRIVDGVHHTPTYVERGVPFLTVQNLTRTTGISLQPERYISEGAHDEYRRRADPGPGDVLVSKDGTLGVARVVPLGLPEFSIFVSIALIRPLQARIRPELVKGFFDTDSYERQLGKQSAGTGLKHIHLEHFREFELRVPPLAEQDRIVTAIAAHQEHMRVERVRLSKLNCLKAGLMEDLLTGRVRVADLEGPA